MANEFDRGVPRGDHDPAADGSAEEREDLAREEGGATKRMDPNAGDGVGQGRHVEGTGRDANLEPDGARGSDRGGQDAWGSERSGGSSIDKR